MKKVLTLVIAITMFVICGTTVSGQTVPMEEKKVPIGMSVGLKSNHLWRGMEVSSGAALTGDLFISTWDESFKFGFWGGYAFNGNWKEFDYYLSYNIAGFSIAVWDIYNFSPGATYDNENIFNYKARGTGHFVDVSLGYRFPDAFPLGINIATVVFGRDRGPKLINGVMEPNEHQRYSTYITLDYPILRSNLVNLDIACSGAFALSPAKDASDNTIRENFYGKTNGIVNVALTASRTFELGKYQLPTSIMCMWNPMSGYANMQIAVTLLQF